MIPTSVCYGYWAECPKSCITQESEDNLLKCFVWRDCKDSWIKSGGKLGLYDIIQDMNRAE
jgi:hypothetical protein